MSLSKLLSSSAKKRRQNLSSVRFDIQQKLFGRFNNPLTVSPHHSGIQIPKLWCEPLCHYTQTKDIDLERNHAHLYTLLNHIGGLIIHGTTGDGWTLTPDQQDTILKQTLYSMQSHASPSCANECNPYVHPIVIGIPAHDYLTKSQCIDRFANILYEHYEHDDLNYIYESSPFIGFAITPPSNTDNQKEMEECLADIIDAHKQFAFVLCQSPQITHSQMSIQTVTNLVNRFGNIIMLNDTSGTDGVLKSQRGLDGVFMVRGVECNPMESLLNMNYGVAQYHGLLLSSANNYGVQLNQLIQYLLNGQWNDAVKLSELITDVNQDTIEIVKEYPFGNQHTNAAKMVDFWMAYGAQGERMIEKGQNIPISQEGVEYNDKDLMRIRDVLSSHGILNQEYVGYMNQHRQWWKKH